MEFKKKAKVWAKLQVSFTRISLFIKNKLGTL